MILTLYLALLMHILGLFVGWEEAWHHWRDRIRQLPDGHDILERLGNG